MTDIIIQGQALEAAHELKTILAEEKKLAARKQAAKAILSQYLVEEGQAAVDADGVIVARMKPGSRRFNPEEARRNLPAPLLALILVETPDSTLAKDMLPPAMYDLCLTRTAASIVAA